MSKVVIRVGQTTRIWGRGRTAHLSPRTSGHELAGRGKTGWRQSGHRGTRGTLRLLAWHILRLFGRRWNTGGQRADLLTQLAGKLSVRRLPTFIAQGGDRAKCV